MPYITEQNRENLNFNPPSNSGEINYTISSICDYFIKEKGLSYATINTLVGALECAKLELYRRIASPYEDTKLEKNGDVYIYTMRDNGTVFLQSGSEKNN
jgi:hypothetical protein